MSMIDPGQLPPFLQETEPMEEVSDIALQVALLTMEMAAMRLTLYQLTKSIEGKNA